MGQDNARTLTPDEAMDHMIRQAMQERTGPLGKIYTEHFKSTYQGFADNYVIENPGAQLDSNVAKALHTKTLEQNAAWAEKMKQIYLQSKSEKEKGLTIDPNASQAAVGSILGGGTITGALSGIAMTLKPVKDFMSAIFNIVGAQFSSMVSKEAPSVSLSDAWSNAWREIEMRDKTTAAINSFTANGVNLDQNAFAAALTNSVASTQGPKELLDDRFEKSTLEKIKNLITVAEAQSKKSVFSPLKPFLENGGIVETKQGIEATPEAIKLIDGLPHALPGRQGNSWAKNETKSSSK